MQILIAFVCLSVCLVVCLSVLSFRMKPNFGNICLEPKFDDDADDACEGSAKQKFGPTFYVFYLLQSYPVLDSARLIFK